MTTRTYITTSIPYVNAAPHIGHALEFVQADAITRYSRLIGCETRFQTCTDENAFKNVEAARKKGVPVQQFVHANSESFRKLCAELRVSADSFLRTKDPLHRRGVETFWKRLDSTDLYRQRYRGLYCIGCEDFYLERDLVEGRCPDHGTRPVVVEEENIFFHLSKYQQRIEHLIRSGVITIIPATRRHEVLSFIRQGLQDFSVSRPAERSPDWGIRVPDDPSQVIYVWIDALINYLSGLGFGSSDRWSDFWNSDTRKMHVIGKNVWKFHAVYWPALLLSAGLPLPDETIVHGFLTVDGKKISKSGGNAVDTQVLIETYGANAVRYFLLSAVPPLEDGDFSIQRLREVYNSELSNGIGNLLSRVTSLAQRIKLESFDAGKRPTPPEGFEPALQRYEFDKAIRALSHTIDAANQDMERVRPWELPTEEARAPVLRWLSVLQCVLHNVLMAKAFVPAMVEKRWGRVIAINTECAMQNFASQSAYVSGKRGMDGVLRVLAKEVGVYQVTVNQVAPGLDDQRSSSRRRNRAAGKI